MAKKLMRVPVINITLLKTQLLGFFASTLIAASIAFWASQILNDTNHTLSDTNQEVSDISEKLQLRQDGSKIYNKIHQQYLALYGKNYQKPDKLHWMEQLQKQAKLLQLPSLTYNIKARTENAKTGITLTEGFTIYSTMIEINAGMIHDGEFLQFIDLLKTVGLDPFSVERCQLASFRQPGEYQSKLANISAQCLLVWYEIERKKTTELAFDPGVIL